MSSRGYSFESEMEDYFLALEGKNKQSPIFDKTGKIARSFRVPTSGMMASMPGDVLTANPNFPHQFMVECKARSGKTKKSGQVFRLDMEWVEKNIAESKEAGYVPLFVLSFKRQKKHRIWAVLDPVAHQILFNGWLELTPYHCQKKKSFVLQKSFLDANADKHFALEPNRILVTWNSCYERIKQWMPTN